MVLMVEADRTPGPPALDEIYVAARRVLLDALTALAPTVTRSSWPARKPSISARAPPISQLLPTPQMAIWS